MTNPIVDYIIENNSGAWLIDNMNEALIGTSWGENGVIAVYSYEKIILILMRDGMDEVEAEEWFSYNIEGAYMGPGNPIYVKTQH